MNVSKNGNSKLIIKRRRLLVTAVGLYLLAIGFLSGILAERIRFDETRSDLITKLEEDTQRVHERLMAMERGETH